MDNVINDLRKNADIMDLDKNLKKGLWGYKKVSVKKYMEDMAERYRIQLADLQRQIEEITNEKALQTKNSEQLLKKYNELSERMTSISGEAHFHKNHDTEDEKNEYTQGLLAKIKELEMENTDLKSREQISFLKNSSLDNKIKESDAVSESYKDRILLLENEINRLSRELSKANDNNNSLNITIATLTEQKANLEAAMSDSEVQKLKDHITLQNRTIEDLKKNIELKTAQKEQAEDKAACEAKKFNDLKDENQSLMLMIKTQKDKYEWLNNYNAAILKELEHQNNHIGELLQEISKLNVEFMERHQDQ